MQIARRQLLTLAGAWLCGCASDQVAPRKGPSDPLVALSPTGEVPDRLRVGMPPSSGANTHERLTPLFAYLSKALGRPVEGVTASTYDQLAVQMERQEIDIGAFSPAAYALSKRAMKAVPIATGTRNGSPTYLGYLVVRKQPERPTLAELRGNCIAWVERSSTSGYLYPRAMLRAKGHDPNTFFGEQRNAGNHGAALAQLLDGEVEVAAAASPFVDPETPTAVEGADQLMVVAKTARIPRDCMVVHQRLQRQLAADVRTALLDLSSEQDVCGSLEASWGLDGFVPPLHRLYDEVARLVAAG